MESGEPSDSLKTGENASPFKPLLTFGASVFFLGYLFTYRLKYMRDDVLSPSLHDNRRHWRYR